MHNKYNLKDKPYCFNNIVTIFFHSIPIEKLSHTRTHKVALNLGRLIHFLTKKLFFFAL